MGGGAIAPTVVRSARRGAGGARAGRTARVLRALVRIRDVRVHATRAIGAHRVAGRGRPRRRPERVPRDLIEGGGGEGGRGARGQGKAAVRGGSRVPSLRHRQSRPRGRRAVARRDVRRWASRRVAARRPARRAETRRAGRRGPRRAASRSARGRGRDAHRDRRVAGSFLPPALPVRSDEHPIGPERTEAGDCALDARGVLRGGRARRAAHPRPPRRHRVRARVSFRGAPRVPL